MRLRPLTTLCLLALVPALAACGGQPGNQASTATPAPAAGAPAAGETPADEATADEDAPTDEVIAEALAPATGDIEEMQAKRRIRMLVTFSRSNYFLDGAKQMGATYEAGRAFEEFINKELKTKNLRIHVVFVPVRRDQ